MARASRFGPGLSNRATRTGLSPEVCSPRSFSFSRSAWYQHSPASVPLNPVSVHLAPLPL
eukprot:2289339-Rhodomonas_salina.5